MRIGTVFGCTFFAFMSGGCPPASSSGTSGPVEVCTKQFQQCKLPGGGQLGVCDARACKEGETAPCYVCMPQH